MITQQELLSLVEYRDGVLFRKSTGKEFCHVRPDGYLRGRAKPAGRLYLAHRLVWIYHYGECPEFLDHINGNRADNRIENLRPATKVQNAANRAIRKSNVSGVKGVSFRSDSKKWRAQIMVNYKTTNLGSFVHKEDAIAAYQAAVKKYNGEFAPVGRAI